ncbi:MAG TPA: YihY/virulence factor BrkB family protein [Jiangellaceae bacterium]|jgi:membrane protein|nr:YihY/virulence factor BrkB family protein [Jiangellaceae bacterium]
MARRQLRRRVEAWLAGRSARLGGFNPWQILGDAVHASTRHRVTGLAAEMAFFASLALIPFTLAFGAVLGYVERWTSPGSGEDVQQVIVQLMTVILGPDLVGDVAEPYVRAQLDQARGGLAIGGFVFGLWLASRVFLPAVHALDLAYGMAEERSALRRRAISVLLAAASLVVIVLQVLIQVFGPLLGNARELANQFGLGDTFTVLWTVGRWPLLAILVTAFLLATYQLVPARRLGWRRSLPGAIIAMLAWIIVAAGFRAYLATGRNPGEGLGAAAATTEALSSVSRALGTLIATVVWVFLSSVAILFGGEINAAIDKRRRGEPRQERTIVLKTEDEQGSTDQERRPRSGGADSK